MTTIDRPFQRRAVLAGGGAAVAALAAACSSDPAPTTTNTPTGSSAAGSAAGSSVAGSAAGSSGATALAAVDDIPDGGSLVAGGVLLARTGDTVTGRSPVCTHMQCTVAAAMAEANCPCHGSKFNASTGAVLNGPATQPLPEVAVTVRDGQVFPA